MDHIEAGWENAECGIIQSDAFLQSSGGLVSTEINR